MKSFIIISTICFLLNAIFSQDADYNFIIGNAFKENLSYPLLQRICDEAGGRLAGSSKNEKAMQILQEDLKKLGYNPIRENFFMTGWIREDDEVSIVSPTQRKLRAFALGYTQSHAPFESSLIGIAQGFEDNYKNHDVKDKVVLILQAKGKPSPFRFESIDIAAKYGARAIIFMHQNPGNFILVSTGNFQGTPCPIPAYAISFEEGKWLERLLKNSIFPNIRIHTKSYCKPIEVANLIAFLPGKTEKKIVLGAHFDSWDLGQGAIDNGIGSVILYDVARILKKLDRQNQLSIEFVWFNAEELGLWGSKAYIQKHNLELDNIVAMVNMDMLGSPIGFNVMGFEEFIPFFQELLSKMDGFDLKDGVVNQPWLGSDHIPFILKGIPSFCVSGYLPEESVRYYHDIGDTFDKVNKKYLSEAAAVVSLLIYELANRENLPYLHKNDKEVIEILRKFKLEERLKKQNEWTFQE